MKRVTRSLREWRRAAAWAPVLLLTYLTHPGHVNAAERDYGSDVLGASSYTQHGPGPAYGAAYGAYGANANGIKGRFSASYGEYGAVPGYGRFGAGATYGTGPLRGAGTGAGGPSGAGMFQRGRRNGKPSQSATSGEHPGGVKKRQKDSPSGGDARAP